MLYYNFHNSALRRMNLIAPASDTRIAFPHHYTPKALLTPTEARFHACLEQISQHRCRIQVKPRLADVFQHQKHDRSAFAKVSQKHIDFLICRNEDWMPMLGIELDDDSHQRKDRKERDMFVNALFASTGIPLLRIHVREIEQVERMVQKLTQGWLQRWAALENGHSPKPSLRSRRRHRPTRWTGQAGRARKARAR
jgi:very-short-patch-repair endonuclease